MTETGVADRGRVAEIPELSPPIGSAATVAGTVNAALIGYYESSAWQALNQSTRKARRSVLEKFRAEHGEKRLALMHAKALVAILDKKTPAAQRNFRKVRGLIAYAIDRGLIDADPFAAVRLAKAKKKGEFDGIIPWMPEECAQFEACFALGTRERLAYEFLLQAGQSKCDVIRMGRQHVRNGMIAMRRKKTGCSSTCR